MRISERQRRLERLAWAGGFFDGEGSTFARGESARPGYRQLNVVVPQAGGFRAPEVLTRFAEALPGLGTIGRPSGGLFQWRATDHTRSRAAVALLHPWIGTIKRRQATIAAPRRRRGDRGRTAMPARLGARRIRAAQGIKPRQFKDERRRYTE